MTADFGDEVCASVAEIVHDLVGADAVLHDNNLQFVAEAIIATARIGTPAALALNAELGRALLSDRLRAVLLHNPRSVALYALPIAYLVEPSPRAAQVHALFERLHDAGAVATLHHPLYRTLELDYVAARLRGRPFHRDPFAGLAVSLPWVDRDFIYGVTHVHFYNSDFGGRCVDYGPSAPEQVALLIAQAAQRDDIDLLLEVLVVEASVAHVDPEYLGFCDFLCARAVTSLCTAGGVVPRGAEFRAVYHPLFVAAIYRATRGAAFAPNAPPAVAARHRSAGSLFDCIARGDLLGAVRAYAAHVERFGPEPALEPALRLQSDLAIAAAADRALSPVA